MSNQQYYGGAGAPPPNQQQYPPPNQQYGANPNAPYMNQPPPNQPPQQQYSAPGSAPPGHHPPQRTGTDAGLPQGQERSEQLEHMQNFEAHAQQTDGDRDQETLRKEFPNIDSSLIAAIYGDSGSLSATREMLHELNSAN